jgi:hypothetical protein
MDDLRSDNVLRALSAFPSCCALLPALAAEVFDGGFAASFGDVEAGKCGELKKKGVQCKKVENGT